MTLERCKEQAEACEKKFIGKVPALLAVIGTIGGGFGLIWGASAWQAKTEMRVISVETISTENRMEIKSIRRDVDKMQVMSNKLDTIVGLLRK